MLRKVRCQDCLSGLYILVATSEPLLDLPKCDNCGSLNLTEWEPLTEMDEIEMDEITCPKCGIIID